MELGTNELSYRGILLDEFHARKRKNQKYSLNAFSRALGVSPATLCQIMSGKRPLSRKAAQKILSRCTLPENIQKQFLGTAFGVGVANQVSPYRELEIEAAKLICDWYHFAILSLANITPNRSDPLWISETLAISLTEARDGFERLVRLGFIEKRGRQFVRTSQRVSFPTKTRDNLFRFHHSQLLDKARECLDWEDAPLELFSSMTMAVDETKLELARTLIRDFRRKLSENLESGARERVYVLTVQLFPVSQRIHKKGTIHANH